MCINPSKLLISHQLLSALWGRMGRKCSKKRSLGYSLSSFLPPVHANCREEKLYPCESLRVLESWILFLWAQGVHNFSPGTSKEERSNMNHDPFCHLRLYQRVILITHANQPRAYVWVCQKSSQPVLYLG